MREYKLVVEPFHYLNYLKIECIKEVNCHGTLKIEGLIDDSQIETYEKLAESEVWVSLKTVDENEIEKVFFQGILTNWEISKEKGCNILVIEVYTGSFLLDLKNHIRSFQLESFLYSDLIQKCLGKDGGTFIMLDKQGEHTNRFLLQYEETDWEFFLRLAGYAGTGLIPEFVATGKKFYFGYPKTKKEEEMISDQYKVIRDVGELERKRNAGMEQIKNSDMQKFLVVSREIYGLGETVSFKQRKMRVGRIVSRLVGSELYHEYHLISSVMGIRMPHNNGKVRGVSLLGNVINVEKTMVKIKIQKDENKDQSENKWFDYATVYSTPDGTGWYCMPEIGDEVRVVFPDEREDNAYVMSSVHIEAAGGRENPDYKSWKNRQGKEVLFTPDSLILRNNQGLVVELSDHEGIKITSNKAISLQAENDVSIASKNAGINVAAASALSMTQGCAKIEMDEAINISGGKIYMN